MRRKPEHGHREHRTPLRLLTFHLAHFRYCVGTGLYTQASSGLMYGIPGCPPEKTTKVRSVSMALWHLSANLQVDPLGCGNGLARLLTIQQLSNGFM